MFFSREEKLVLALQETPRIKETKLKEQVSQSVTIKCQNHTKLPQMGLRSKRPAKKPLLKADPLSISL